jgi:DNA-binding FadR family transcriptional regulator
VEIFTPARTHRISEGIVDQIKAMRRNGRLRPGDRLPTEREMCERFGVSRVTLREALRILEVSGLVTIRVGGRGGTFLASPTVERLGDGLAELLSLAPLTPRNTTETRMIIELGVLPLAVERATSEDVEELRAMLADAERAQVDGTYTCGMAVAFHNRIGECTHNPTIVMLLRGFYGPIRTSIERWSPNAPISHYGISEHRDLVDAIEAHDVDAARTGMVAHLTNAARRIGAVEGLARSDRSRRSGS